MQTMMTLAVKEVRDNLLTLRFDVALFLVLCMYITATLIFCDKYQARLEQDASSRAYYASALETGRKGLQALYDRNIWLSKDPTLTAFLASSTESRIPATSDARPSTAGSNPFGGMGLRQVRTNYVLDSESDLDMVFIVGIVLSFLAIVLAYDAVSRDREAGTLKQQLSNAIPRTHVLLGKYLALLALLLIPVVIGSLVSIVIVRMLTGQNILLTIPVEAAVSCLLSVVYLSIFIWVGLSVSASVSRSATSLAILLILWIAVVVLFPYVGGMLAYRLHPVASLHQYVERFKSVEQSVTVPKEMADFLHGKESEKGWEPLQAYYDRLGEIDKKLLAERFTELMGQADAAGSINFFSPYSAYRGAIENIASTGLEYHSRFIRAVQRYREDLATFIRQEDRLDGQSKHRVCPDDNFKSISHKPVDPATIPRFAPRRTALTAADAQMTLPALGYLILLNIAAFFWALKAFSKADVR